MNLFFLLAAILACFTGGLAQSSCTFPNLRELHYNDRGFKPPIIYQTTGFPNYNWKTGAAFTGGPVDYFCIRWDGTINFPSAGNYTFQAYSDDGIRLYVNGTLVLNRYSFGNANSPINGTVTYFNSGPATFVAEYFELDGSASIRTLWRAPGSSVFVDIPSSVYSTSNCTTKVLNVTNPTFNDATEVTTFTVGLSSQPISDVVLTLNSTCMSFSNCTYTIPVGSWSAGAALVGYPNPTNVQYCCPVTITVSDGDPDYFGQTKTITSCRSSASFKTAVSWGDPHMLTFDGLKYDNFKIGDFYAVRQTNGEFAMQQRQQKCGGATCNFGLAVKFQGTVFYLFTDSVTGLPVSSVAGISAATTGVTLTLVNGVYTFSTPTGIVVTASVGKWNGRPIYYLNANVRVSTTFQGKLVGLMGYFDGSTANDLMLPSGGQAASLSAFIDSWRVNATNNLFTSATASIPTLLGASANKTLSVNPLKCSPVTGDISSNYTNSTTSPLQNTTTPTGNETTPDCTVWTDLALKASAIASCSPAFNGTLAQCCSALGVDGNNLYATCLCDYNLAGDDTFTQDSVNAFIGLCTSAALSANASCNPCPSNCNGRGTCANGTCTCSSGYVGKACEENWNDLPSITTLSAFNVSRSCAPTTLTVSGENFFGSSLLCMFEGLANVTATKLSNFQLTCAFPTIPSGATSLTLRIIRSGVVSNSSATLSVVTNCCDAPCKNNATCTSLSSSPFFSCACVAPYVGTTCATTCDLLATPVVTFAASDTNKTVQFYLNGKPSSTITVTFSSSCMLVSNCSITFTPLDYNIPKTITLTRNTASSETACSLVATAAGSGTCAGTNSTTLITKADSKFALAYSYGDPHMLTFDGLKYDNFLLGDYVLTRTLTGEFVIQARQDKCATASCNYAVAVKYYGVVYYVFLTKAGVPSTQLIGDPASYGVSIYQPDGTTFNFDPPNGMQVSIKVGMWLFRGVPTYHLTVNLRAGESLKGKLAGLLGNYDGNPSNEYTTPANASASQSTFINSWAVPAGESLLADPAAVIPAIWNATLPTYTAGPASNCDTPAPKPSNSTDSPLKNSTTPNDPDYVPPDCTVWANQTFKDAAIASCSPSFNSSTAKCCSDNGVSGDGFYASCLCDYNLLGGPSFTQTNVQGFFDACQATLSQLGVSCNPCPNNCNGNGNCTNGTCACSPGYLGKDCGENWNDPPTIVDLTPTSADFSCNLVVTILGTGFYGTDLLCSFSGVAQNVTATKVSNYELTCPLPTNFPAGQNQTTVRVIRAGATSSGVNVTLVESCCKNPCQNNGTCVGAPSDPSFTCQCVAPFVGSRCATTCDLLATSVVTFASGDLSKTVQFSLNAKPNSTVTVTLTSSCMYLSNCSITFTPLDYNIPKTVTLTRNPSNTETTCALYAQSSGNGTCSTTNSTTAIYKPDAKYAAAYSYGDPHMLTFDGLKYDNFVLGDYVLTRTLAGDFVIQARQDKCATASCNYAVAIRYYQVVLYVFLTKAGVPSSQLIGDPAAVGATVSLDGGVYSFNTPSGFRVNVTVGMWLFRGVPTYHLTVNLKAGQSLRGKVIGLLGNYDGNPNNEFATPANTSASQSAFIASWAVSASENLFTSPTAVIAPLFNATVPTFTAAPSSSCGPPPTKNPSNSTDSPLKNSTTPNDPSYVPPDCTVWANQTFKDAAIASCSPHFNSTTAKCCSDNGVSGEGFYESCLCDYNLLGGPSFTQTNVQGFLDACQATLSQLGVSCSICPNNCNGNGNCTNGTCACSPGYLGKDCGENWNDPPSPSESLPASAGYTCSLDVTINGANFYGTDLLCSFSGVAQNVTATKVSNYQIICPLPTNFPAGQASTSIRVIRAGVISTASVNLTFYDSCCKNPCQNNATCVGAPNSPSFTCQCVGNYGGNLCQYAGQCSNQTVYGGTIGPLSALQTGALLCPAGQIWKITATCGSDQAYTNWTIACANVSGSCPAEFYDNADFPQTLGGLPARGTCRINYSGTPMRSCLEGGTWGTQVATACTRNTCPSETAGGVTWPATPSSTNVSLSCPSGLIGSPKRSCSVNGVWSTVTGPCVTAQSCPESLSYAHSDFPPTSESTMASGVCNVGYTGSPTRYCKAGGVWETLVRNVCTRTSCPDLNDGVATYLSVFSGETRYGTCLGGKTGSPKRKCDLATATWLASSGTCK